MTSGPPKIAIVVVNWNGRDLTLACLDSVTRSGSPPVTTVVVDNGSTDGSMEALRERSDIALIEGRTNVGFAAAANRGIRATREPWILLLNNDVLLDEPDVLARSLSYAEAHPDLGALGVRLRNPDGTLQISCARFPSLAAELRNSIPARLVAPPRPDLLSYSEAHHRRTGPVDWVMGAFLLLRRQALDQVGLLDQRLFMYGEDCELCYRLRAHGWKTYFLSEPSAMHVGNASAARAFSPDERAVRVNVAERAMLERHRGPAYAWAYSVFVLLDRASRLAAARVLGRTGAVRRLSEEVRARARALARR